MVTDVPLQFEQLQVCGVGAEEACCLRGEGDRSPSHAPTCHCFPPTHVPPLQSAIEPEFWETLGTKKLDDWKLSEAPVAIVGFIAPAGHSGIASPLRLTRASLGEGAPPVSMSVCGR